MRAPLSFGHAGNQGAASFARRNRIEKATADRVAEKRKGGKDQELRNEQAPYYRRALQGGNHPASSITRSGVTPVAEMIASSRWVIVSIRSGWIVLATRCTPLSPTDRNHG